MWRSSVSLELLPKHRLAPVPLIFGVGFLVIAITSMADTSLDEAETWLWATALIVVGLAGLVAVLDRVRSSADQDEPSVSEAEPSPSDTESPVES